MQDTQTPTFDGPEYSFGNHFDDPLRIVIKVDEGKYKNSVFCYDNISVGENENIMYDLDLLTLCADCDIIEVTKIPQDFIDEVSNKILTDILLSQAKRVINESGN